MSTALMALFISRLSCLSFHLVLLCLISLSLFFKCSCRFFHTFLRSVPRVTSIPLSSSTVSSAKTKPITSEPEIHGSHSLDGLTGFLLLMSEGLINALESAHGPEQVNQVRGEIFCFFFMFVQLSFLILFTQILSKCESFSFICLLYFFHPLP